MSEISSQASEDLFQLVHFDVTITIVIEPAERFQDFCARELLEVEIRDNIGEFFELDSSVLYEAERNPMHGNQPADLLSTSMARNICRAS